MAAKTLRGVVPILITPFDEQGRIDVDSLQNLIDFNIAAGVAGLGVALGSEVFKFNEAERDLITKKVVDKVNSRVPVVINTGAHGTDLALQYSRSAEALGADALMVIPPHFVPVGPGDERTWDDDIHDPDGTDDADLTDLTDTGGAHPTASRARGQA